MKKRYILLILLLSVIFLNTTQAQNKKYTGQWLINLSGKYTEKGYGFSLGGEKYLSDSYSSLRVEFALLHCRNNFKITDLKCHVNSYFLNFTYFYSLETLNTKPFVFSLGGGIFVGMEKINGTFPFGVIKEKDNHLLLGLHFTPQAEILLYKNWSAYLEPSVGVRTNSLQDIFMYSVSLGLKYYLPFK